MHVSTYESLAGGRVRVREEVVVPEELDDLPRVGVVLELVPGLESVEWFGTGPHETYPDRRTARLGRWRSTVGAQYVPYVRPQEGGGHADVRELIVRDENAGGVRIRLGRPSQVSATHVRAAELARASHDVEVVPCDEVVVHLDAAHRGLGTASCGPDTLPGYLVRGGTYSFSWSLEPLS
jgi:beta-galactosidase